jgi:hypothetical protein
MLTHLGERKSLPIGVIQDGVVGQQVQHPGGQGLEPWLKKGLM